MNSRTFFIWFVCRTLFRTEAVCRFFVSIWLLLLPLIIFCGDSFDSAAGKVVVVFHDVSLKKQLHFPIVLFLLLSFVLCFACCHHWHLMLLRLQILVYCDHVYFPFIKSFWATDVFLLVSAMSCFLSFL